MIFGPGGQVAAPAAAPPHGAAVVVSGDAAYAPSSPDLASPQDEAGAHWAAARGCGIAGHTAGRQSGEGHERDFGSGPGSGSPRGSPSPALEGRGSATDTQYTHDLEPDAGAAGGSPGTGPYDMILDSLGPCAVGDHRSSPGCGLSCEDDGSECQIAAKRRRANSWQAPPPPPVTRYVAHEWAAPASTTAAAAAAAEAAATRLMQGLRAAGGGGGSNSSGDCAWGSPPDSSLPPPQQQPHAYQPLPVLRLVDVEMGLLPSLVRLIHLAGEVGGHVPTVIIQPAPEPCAPTLPLPPPPPGFVRTLYQMSDGTVRCGEQWASNPVEMAADTAAADREQTHPQVRLQLPGGLVLVPLCSQPPAQQWGEEQLHGQQGQDQSRQPQQQWRERQRRQRADIVPEPPWTEGRADNPVAGDAAADGDGDDEAAADAAAARLPAPPLLQLRCPLQGSHRCSSAGAAAALRDATAPPAATPSGTYPAPQAQPYHGGRPCAVSPCGGSGGGSGDGSGGAGSSGGGGSGAGGTGATDDRGTPMLRLTPLQWLRSREAGPADE